MFRPLSRFLNTSLLFASAKIGTFSDLTKVFVGNMQLKAEMSRG
ncbi:hypothetical protein HMPREF9999_00388 [Alloprevotella sp. oral taxon 473 str. F0040]|nr:hypothetical protein HMPREF9999_00388 [Alloprevotella sp. oral taxon 473 str. F0040]